VTASQPAIPAKTATEWLSYIEALHPKSIAMGLDRVNAVLEKLQLKPNFPIITVAGTNGKGSVCAMLSQIYVQSGYHVGTYSSPHIHRYNERVCVNLKTISDEDLCTAFAAVEAARGQAENGKVTLTYFEMGTLAAMWHFCKQNLDICILEVGLGGRLDAVNAFEPSCAIVTTVDLDHMEFLGDTRELIGLEKAGVYRTNKLAICGDDNPPKSLVNYAQKIGANLQLIGRDFKASKTKTGWQYVADDTKLALPLPSLIGDFQLNNAACVVRAVLYLNTVLPVALHEGKGDALQANIHEAFRAVHLIGRFQTIQTEPLVIADVAHNPHAAKSLAQNLKSKPCAGKTLAVFGMLRDKDMAGVVQEMRDEIDVWYLADIQNTRGATAAELLLALNQNSKAGNNKTNNNKTVRAKPTKQYANIAAALAAACIEADKNDRIIAFGSFYTVADAIDQIKHKQQYF
jgi:dihydrofolate synthase / folylpolyglutamate synthase